jgi:hypothetical protein
VKYTVIFSLLLASIVLTGCPSSSEEAEAAYLSDLERLQKNDMDFPDVQRFYFAGMRYRLSSMFYASYYDEFVLADEYEVKVNDELNLYFSIEIFRESEAESIRYQFDNEEMSLLAAVHDNYAIKRNASLEEATISIKKPVPKSVGFPGVMQTISGVNYEGIPPNTYFFASLKIVDDIVVVQLIGKEENMGYLYDDFIDILSSISL